MGKKYTSLIISLMAAPLAVSAMAEEGHGRHAHRHHFSKDVDAFHSVLAPLWHAAPGKARSRNACAKADDMESLARDIRSGDASPLIAAVVALKTKCRDGRADIDTALTDVHEAFHRLAEPAR